MPQARCFIVKQPIIEHTGSTVGDGAREMFHKGIMDMDTILEPAASPPAISSLSTPTSTIGNGLLETLIGDLMDGDARPELNSSSETNPTLSMPAFTVGTDDDLDNFLEDVMHEGTIPEEDMHK